MDQFLAGTVWYLGFSCLLLLMFMIAQSKWPLTLSVMVSVVVSSSIIFAILWIVGA
jgi:hypothetical protein